MQVTPKAGPATAAPQGPTSTETSRTRAISAFKQASTPQAQSHPVPNPSQISPEMMSAVTSQVQEPEVIAEEVVTESVEGLETAPTEQKPQDPASRQFAQLAKREKQLRQQFQKQEDAFKAREAALQAREQQLSSQPKTDLSNYYSKDQIKQNYLQVLVDAGVPIEEAVQQLVNTSNTPRDPRTEATISELKQQINELRQANEDSKKNQIEAQNQQYQAAVKQIRTDVTNLVKTDPAYEIIKATGSVKDVVELITETYNKDGVLLSIEEAAQQVEDYLSEEALKLTKLQKIQKRQAELSAKSKPLSTPKTPGAVGSQPQPMKTLTNAVASSRPLTAKERAILAFKGQLSS